MKNLNKNNWNEMLVGLAIVEFWSSGCGPCKVIAPTLDGLSLEYDDIKFGKLNVDDDQDGQIFNKFEVSAVPTILFLKNGEEMDRLVGLQSEAELRKWIEDTKKLTDTKTLLTKVFNANFKIPMYLSEEGLHIELNQEEHHLEIDLMFDDKMEWFYRNRKTEEFFGV
jgi:thioredoxin 1